MLALIVAWGAAAQDKAAVAIGTFDEILVPHFQIDAWMAQAPADAVAGHAGGIDFNDFGGFHRHEALYFGWAAGIIVLTVAPARG